MGIYLIISHTLVRYNHYNTLQSSWVGWLFDGSCRLDCSLGAFETFWYVFSLYHSTRALCISRFFPEKTRSLPLRLIPKQLLCGKLCFGISRTGMCSSCLLGTTSYVFRRYTGFVYSAIGHTLTATQVPMQKGPFTQPMQTHVKTYL